jgi:hypothetical protein
MVALDIGPAVNERAPWSAPRSFGPITERYTVADQRDDAEAVPARCCGKRLTARRSSTLRGVAGLYAAAPSVNPLQPHSE